MATTTPKFGFSKPAGSEFADETVDLNNNWNLADTYLNKQQVKTKTVSTTREETAMAIDPHLQGFNLVKNTVYRYKGWLLYNCSLLTNTDLKIELHTNDNFSRNVWGGLGLNSSATSVEGPIRAEVQNRENAVQSLILTHGGVTGAMVNLIFEGVILTGTVDLTLDLWWAPFVDDSSFVLENDSWMKVWRN